MAPKNGPTDPPAARFGSAAEFRRWLAKHHKTATELIVRCFKVAHASQGLTYKEAVDEALCFGWIDGVRWSHGDDSFLQRFTPRQQRSNWSRINIRKVEALIAAGRMAKPGLTAFQARDNARTGVYAFERRAVELDPALVDRFRRNRKAWADFQARPAWYQRTCSHWIMSAKRAETRDRRLALLIDCSARGTTIPALTRP